MEQLSVETGNKLIAEFMGLEFIPEHRDDYGNFNSDKWKGENGAMYELPGYHSSWDWLMPVVEKIMEVSEMHNLQTTIDYIFSRTNNRFNGISDLWDSATQFIQWYQTQNKQQP